MEIVYCKYSDTIRLMPQNYLLCHWSSSGNWVCDPDSAVGEDLCNLVFKVLIFEAYRFKSANKIVNRITEGLPSLDRYKVEKDEIQEAKLLLEDCKIVEAIKVTNGWKNTADDNPIWKFHEAMKDFLFAQAKARLPENYRDKLETKFCHPTYFLEGISKARAIEYFYLSSDFEQSSDFRKIVKQGERSVTPTIAMKAYWHALDEVVIAIFDKKISIQFLIDEINYIK